MRQADIGGGVLVCSAILFTLHGRAPCYNLQLSYTPYNPYYQMLKTSQSS